MEEFNKYDVLKYELFECLLPGLLYTGTLEEQLSVITELEDEKENLIQQLLGRMCEEDGIEYPFEEDAFRISRYEQGGVHFIEIAIPESDPQINYALRAYILYANEREVKERIHWRYFLVKKFCEKGHVHILYVTPDREMLLGDELTDRVDDREYERRCLARNFFAVLVRELGIGEKEE